MHDILEELIKDPEKRARLLLLYRIGILLSYIFIVIGIIFFFVLLFLK
ncbi:MAG: hypothetical protein J7J75_03180 [Euryarchaeota archaeon]|nr:hypothetical protein [Euryarchaeota archaeon]